MSAVPTGNAAFHPKCGKKLGLTSGMSRDVNPVEGKRNPPTLTRRLKGSNLSGVTAKEQESFFFLAKGGFGKRDPAKRSGFLLGEKKVSSVIYEIHPKHFLGPVRNNGPLRFLTVFE